MDLQEVAFTENYDIATYRFKSIVDEDVGNLTATSEEINEKQFQFGTHGNLLGGKTAMKESDQNIRQFNNSQKRLIHVTSPYYIWTLSSKQLMRILKLTR